MVPDGSSLALVSLTGSRYSPAIVSADRGPGEGPARNGRGVERRERADMVAERPLDLLLVEPERHE